MKYVALYRKLRPKSFDEVISQEHITKTLKNQIKQDRVSHAYLFCGTRGTGKTSTAKIFAKVLNCENEKDAVSCEKCKSCIAFNENRNIDILEIDAASNNGVEDIRDIRENVKYPPTNSKYKVYIIDEVHMLSLGAFNALLKTLEEPPSHVVFILATTDAHKIPITILSRCQRFDFKRIGVKDMVGSIKKYMKDEKINIQDDALHYICQISDGAMRDALSILDQCISFYYKEDITLEKVLNVVGAVDDDVFFKFAEALFSFDTERVLKIIDKTVQDGRDISQFISDATLHFRNLVVSKTATENIFDISDEKFEKLKKYSEKVDTNILIKAINEFSNMQTSLKYAFDGRIVLEITCIKICKPILEEDISDILKKVNFLEKKMSEKIVYVENSKNFKEKNKQAENIEKAEEYEGIDSEKLQKVVAKYKKFKDMITDDMLGATLNKVKLEILDNGILYFVTEKTFSSVIENSKEELQKNANKVFDENYKIEVISFEEFEKIKNRKKIEKDIINENITEQSEQIKHFKEQININIEEK